MLLLRSSRCFRSRRGRAAACPSFERLEQRLLFAITDSLLVAPFTPGITETRGDYVGTSKTPEQTIMSTIVGSATINGHSATEIEVATTTGSRKTYSTNYESLNPTVGLVDFATTSNSQGGASYSAGFETFNPDEIIAPPIMGVGTTYTHAWTQIAVTAITPTDGKTTTTTSVSASIEALSAKSKSITVPAGKYSCYEFKLTETETPEGGKSSTTTEYVYGATGVGPVELVTAGYTEKLMSHGDTPPAANHLVFASQPSNTTAGAVPQTHIIVDVDNQANQVVTSDHSTVTLAAQTGLGAYDLTAVAKNGVATFTLPMQKVAGTYTLVALDGGDYAAESNSFVVAPGAPTQVQFYKEPSDTLVNKSISPAITVAVLDQYDNLETTNSSMVTLTLKSGPGTLLGTTKVAAKNGIATFAGIHFNKAGTYSLEATDGSLKLDLSITFAIEAPK